MPGKRVQLDEESWAALRLLARDRMMTFQELADEAFADVLKKHGRPVDLRAALRKSAQAADAPEHGRAKTRNGKSPRR
jgi:predicted DNA-binding ribbon-helix-helix protein